MVKARIGKNPKVLMVFDTIQHKQWATDGRVSEKGIESLLRKFKYAGVSFDDVSAVCLADVYDKPKASDYKYKAPYVEELIETYGFNVCVPVGAGAFEKIAGIKGAAKYAGRTLMSEKIPTLKLLPCPSPSAVKYDPGVNNVISEVVRKTAVEMEYPEIRDEDKLETHYQVIDTLQAFDRFYEYFVGPLVPEFAYDLETTGLYFNIDEILTIQFTHKVGHSYLIPCNTVGSYPAAPNPWSAEEWEYVKSKLKILFTEPNKTVIGHNKKFDDKFIFYHWGIPLQKGRSFDTLIASFLCDENTPNDLKSLACSMTDLGDYELPLEKFKDEFCKKNKILKKQSRKNPEKPYFSYGMIPYEIIVPYALTDTDATYRLYLHFKEELKKEEQEETFKLVMRITWLLTRFELAGWPINVSYGEELKNKLKHDIAELEAELLTHPAVKKAEQILAARKLEKENVKRKNKLSSLKESFVFNLGSNEQKKVLFFEVLGFPTVKFSKVSKKPATDKEAVSIWMRTIPEHKKFLQDLQHYSEMSKFLSTYVLGILSKTVNGRVHPTYNACGARTGRTSSSSPNFQNLPARGDDRKMKLVKSIKRMVEAGEDKVLLGADLSAIEMAWACIVSGDKKLEEIFINGIDIHGAVAKELFDYITCPPNEVKKLYEFERNSVSKTVQFLSIYGGGCDALAKKVNESIIERQEMAKAKGETLELVEYTKEMAQGILDDYFRKYSGVNQYIKDTTLQVMQKGYATSIYGYRRRVPAVNSEDEGVKAQAIRQACNATIQNPASVSLLLALCNLQEEVDEMVEKGELGETDFLLTGSVHDAGYQEVNKAILITARDMLLKHMTAPPIENCPIPIRAEAEFGKNWAEFSTDFGTAMVEDEVEEDEEEDIDKVE